uniref:Uncharacterized protein n=1 Tax=Rhizophora mucronata TaxID=61149 RepID=A0A2P2PCY4_RHIMU
MPATRVSKLRILTTPQLDNNQKNSRFMITMQNYSLPRSQVLSWLSISPFNAGRRKGAL